jgi:uncharacterized protein YtpQ (UPF0354 family)
MPPFDSMFRRLLHAVGFGPTGPPDPEAFTREVLAIFQQEARGQKVEMAGPLELTVAAPDGSTHTVHLDNLIQTCAANPKHQADEIARFAEVLTNLSTDDPTLPKDVVPVVRDRTFATEMEQSMRERAKPDGPKPELFFEPLGADLIVLYVKDDPQTSRYLLKEDIEELHLAGQTLRELGLENLRRILPEIKSEGANGLHFFSADNCYEPSLILNTRIWERFKQEIGGEILFAIPARGTLFVADSAVPEAIEFLQKAAREVYQQQPYRISDKIYVRHADRIDFYNPDQQTLAS